MNFVVGLYMGGGTSLVIFLGRCINLFLHLLFELDDRLGWLVQLLVE